MRGGSGEGLRELKVSVRSADNERSKFRQPMKTYSQLIINIGCPRTGTTTIQLHLLQLAKKHNVLSKIPYTSDNFLTKNSTSSFTPNSIRTFISNITDSEVITIRNDISAAIRILSLASVNIDQKIRETCQPLLQDLLEKILTTSTKPLIMHDERLSDSGASLSGDSSHKEDCALAIYATISALDSLRQTPRITACFREPISYLKSKYTRTVSQRKFKGLRKISPNEYIQKQAHLESNHPGTSALTPAMHAEFIKQLQQHAFVKAFGFQELLASDDVFSLMGLQGEDKYAFRDFPRENKLPFTKEQEQEIEIEITQALKAYGFYDRIMKAQMFK